MPDKMSTLGRLRGTLVWQLARSLGVRQAGGALRGRVIALGQWLKSSDYTGIDVSPDNPPRKISTTLAFSMIAWRRLAEVTGQDGYLEEAQDCLSELLDMQTAAGCWLFPYSFRDNPPEFPYSCENFMTIECLIDYWQMTGRPRAIQESVDRAITCLRRHIGHDGGLFWYSASDRIRVPNISSMAARVFSSAFRMFGDPEYLELAGQFANYCVSQQASNGAYPYFEESPMVYVPYHALEVWELAEANKDLEDAAIAQSVDKAIGYLRDFIARHGYVSKDPPVTGAAILMKTPIWAAKAFLAAGFKAEARRHFDQGLRLFRVPTKACCLYLLKRAKGLAVPFLETRYVRYNASAFEIGTSLVCDPESPHA